jgi:hypothetical protein
MKSELRQQKYKRVSLKAVKQKKKIIKTKSHIQNQGETG